MLISGEEKLDRMRDGRTVYIGSEKVDVELTIDKYHVVVGRHSSVFLISSRNQITDFAR